MLSFLANLFSFALAAFDWLRGRQQQQIGELRQQQADDEATIKGAEYARRVEESFKNLPDDQLDARLARSMREPGAEK